MDKKELATLGVLPKTKYTAKPTEEIIEAVINDVEEILVQRTKEAREFTMKVAWETGEVLRESEKKFKVNISALVTRIALDNRLTGRQMGERNLWFALKFFDSFPAFEKVYETEHGENISLSKVKKMLTTPKPKKEKTIKEIAIALVEGLGVEKARQLIKEIEKECDKVEAEEAAERDER